MTLQQGLTPKSEFRKKSEIEGCTTTFRSLEIATPRGPFGFRASDFFRELGFRPSVFLSVWTRNLSVQLLSNQSVSRRETIFLLASLIGALGVFLPGLAEAGRGDTDAEGRELFERRIRPVLAGKCYPCHSARAEKSEGGLVWTPPKAEPWR